MFTTIKNNIPNAITCGNLVCGALACIYALKGNPADSMNYHIVAFILIGLAAVFDFFDGFVARMIHAVSGIGKELDSLCDCVSFGLAPALLVYSILGDSPLRYAALLIAVGGALRLARFNCDDTQTTSFVGLPIPANAIFWVGFVSWWDHSTGISPWVVLPFILLLSWLMVSPMRIFSLKLKNLKFADNIHVYALIAATITFVAIWGVAGLAWTIMFYVVESLFVKVPVTKK